MGLTLGRVRFIGSRSLLSSLTASSVSFLPLPPSLSSSPLPPPPSPPPTTSLSPRQISPRPPASPPADRPRLPAASQAPGAARKVPISPPPPPRRRPARHELIPSFLPSPPRGPSPRPGLCTCLPTAASVWEPYISGDPRDRRPPWSRRGAHVICGGRRSWGNATPGGRRRQRPRGCLRPRRIGGTSSTADTTAATRSRRPRRAGGTRPTTRRRRRRPSATTCGPRPAGPRLRFPRKPITGRAPAPAPMTAPTLTSP